MRINSTLAVYATVTVIANYFSVAAQLQTKIRAFFNFRINSLFSFSKKSEQRVSQNLLQSNKTEAFLPFNPAPLIHTNISSLPIPYRTSKMNFTGSI